jgi:predicted nucleic acid-binding protein
VLALIAMNASMVDAAPLRERVSADPDDDKFLGAAIAAKASIVVSGDQDLLEVSGWRGIDVLTLRAFVDRHLVAG